MNTKQAYNSWASQYDSNDNKTRDLEALALRQSLDGLSFDHCLEIGCGTGKNTVWLAERSRKLTAADQSEEMMAKAREKIKGDHVDFVLANIMEPWPFGKEKFDLVSFSLVLEHIRDLEPIFKEVAAALKPGGYVYIGELHPFKQYSGTKARFETAEGLQVVDCYDHHLSDFIEPALANGLTLVKLSEYFDDDNRENLPRILSLFFKKAF